MIYYTPPSDESFEDMKTAALQVWNSYEDPYRTEKVNRIKDIENISDNFMYILAMFDINNQKKVGKLLTEATKEDARDRMLSGGMMDWELPF